MEARSGHLNAKGITDMQTLRYTTIRWLSYPLIIGLAISAQLMIAIKALPYWPLAPLVAGIGIAAVALLERVQPYQREWLNDHRDTLVDILHAMTSLTLIFVSLEIAALTRTLIPVSTLWPTAWPVWGQVLLAGAIIDFGLWFMHWLSHKNGFLWRLHALHHSSERLYWLNGERRHPFSALVLSLPGVSVVILLGAPPTIIGCWFSIVAVHLAFQHANLDYTLGPCRSLLGVAEIHRWHHKREYEDAQVNFGEVWMIWDHLFGTYRYQANGVVAGEVGMRESMPVRYLDQLVWPFQNTHPVDETSTKSS
jgi:sterol desaturase/sphingolipid hydroxylase (fatty acid hydroxylase superfamily)